tara:strand:+ start:245 stop:481 length:237 start_codon:yes stop_codon:yes gene_type:complete
MLKAVKGDVKDEFLISAIEDDTLGNPGIESDPFIIIFTLLVPSKASIILRICIFSIASPVNMPNFGIIAMSINIISLS